MTPRSKHYTIKYHWFWEHIGPRNIVLVKIRFRRSVGRSLHERTQWNLILSVAKEAHGMVHPWLLFQGGVWQVLA